jgi:hypothetical protein
MTIEERREYDRKYNKTEKRKKYMREYMTKWNKSSKSSKYKIYRLVYEGKIIYVGHTKLALSRRKGSANYSVPKDIYKLSKIELIEETESRNRERYWIEYYISKNEPLMNKRNGDF